MGLIESILERLFPPTAEPLAGVRRGRRTVVRGRVVPRDLIDSPLTGAACVYYRYVVEEWRRSALVGLGADGLWVVSEQDEAIAEFYIDDGTGRAVVSPVRAVVAVPSGAPSFAMHEDARRASEVRIAPGDVVEIEASVEEIDDLLDVARGYREHPARLLLRAGDGGVVKIRLVERGPEHLR